MSRLLPRLAWMFAALLLAGAPAGGAYAQDILRPPGNVPRPPANVPQGGFNLFGGWTLFKPQPAPVEAPPPKRPPPEPEGTVHASADAAVEGKKQPPTQFVLVLGDQWGGQLAQGLADLYVRDRSNPAVVGRTDDEAGFLPPDQAGLPDILQTIPQAVADAKPNAVVLALGANDLRPIRDGDQSVEPLTDRWNELFGRRVDEVLAALRARAAGVILVGLAPVQNAATSAQYEKINDILRTRAARAGATFVSVWDGFVDEEGKYAASGPAVDGQRRRLRLGDGVRFTRAGSRKLAYFAQKDVTRLLAEPAPEIPGVLDGRPQALSLTDGPRGASALVGAAAVPASVPAGDAARALTEGAPLEAVPGRADDHSWPARAFAPPAPAARDAAAP
ncbi:GDSL-type esterase/lipase family protein [Aquabacter spiritensis]|nr:GDSL-type esterase/lipase family protein [Aquabacter spiritensis]